MAVDHDDGLTDVEGSKRGKHLAPPCDIGGRIGIGPSVSERADRHQEIRRHILDPDHPKAVAFEDATDAREQMIVAAAKRREHMADHAKRAPIKPDLGQCRPYQRADENQVAAALAAKQSYRAPNLSNRYPVVTKAFDAAGIARAFQREQHAINAACFQAIGNRKRHRSTCRDQADRRCDL